jgi:ribosomal protein S20
MLLNSNPLPWRSSISQSRTCRRGYVLCMQAAAEEKARSGEDAAAALEAAAEEAYEVTMQGVLFENDASRRMLCRIELP